MINKMNKKGVITGGFLIGVILLFLLVMLILNVGSGTLVFATLSKVPTLIWVIVAVILLFKLGGKK